MSGKCYPEEFKIEAVKQVTDHGYKVGEVARRLGVTPKVILNKCITTGRTAVSLKLYEPLSKPRFQNVKWQGINPATEWI